MSGKSEMSDNDSVRTEDVESDSMGEEEEDITIRMVEKDDIALKDSSMEGAGKGVFCKRDVAAGTVLPYYALVQKLSEVKEDQDDTYFMSVTYVNEEEKTRNIQTMIADGNPSLSCIRKLPRQFRAASYVNEGSTSPPNGVFVNNLTLSKNDIVKAYRDKTPIPITLMVIPHDLDKGEELLTMYGSDYQRDYKVWRDRKGYREAIVNLAHEIVDECKEDLARML